MSAIVRVNLLTQGLVLRGYTIHLRDKNSFIMKDDNETGRNTPAIQLIIGNVPMSYSNTVILQVIKNL